MKTFALLAMSILVLGSPLAAQSPQKKPTCDDAMHKQFDFWIGSWDVKDPDGKEQGMNTIEKILDGCVLRESWVGAGGTSGHSYNVYSRSTKQWHQTWVDSTGGLLLLDGGLDENGSMVLSGTRKARDGSEVIDRITWSPIAKDHVRQHWEVSKDGGKTWSTAFDGHYFRKK